jgi:hypothetical protein
MKIQDFCLKIRTDEDSLFTILRALQEMDAQTLVERSSALTWDPWTRSLESVSA